MEEQTLIPPTETEDTQAIETAIGNTQTVEIPQNNSDSAIILITAAVALAVALIILVLSTWLKRDRQAPKRKVAKKEVTPQQKVATPKHQPSKKLIQ